MPFLAWRTKNTVVKRNHRRLNYYYLSYTVFLVAKSKTLLHSERERYQVVRILIEIKSSGVKLTNLVLLFTRAMLMIFFIPHHINLVLLCRREVHGIFISDPSNVSIAQGNGEESISCMFNRCQKHTTTILSNLDTLHTCMQYLNCPRECFITLTLPRS